jgi:hypothetical protein
MNMPLPEKLEWFTNSKGVKVMDFSTKLEKLFLPIVANLEAMDQKP